MANEKRSSSGERGNRPAGEFSVPEIFSTERELIVIVKPETGLRVTRAGVASAKGADVTPLVDVLTSEGITIEPLFDESEERLKHEAASLAPTTDVEIPDLSIYYRVEAGVMKTLHIRVSSTSQNLAIFVPFCHPVLNRQ